MSTFYETPNFGILGNAQFDEIIARHHELVEEAAMPSSIEEQREPTPYIRCYEGISSGNGIERKTVFISGSSHPRLGHEIATRLGFKLVGAQEARQPNGDSRIRIETNLRDRNVIVFQAPGGRDVNHHIMEALLIGDAIRRNSGRERTLLLSKYPYDRQERQSSGFREPISASAIANLAQERGYNRFMTGDLHTDAIMGTVEDPWDRIFSTNLLVDRIKKWNLDNPLLVAPDAGFLKGAYNYASRLEWDYININKHRDPRSGKVSMTGINGDPGGFDCVIVDDVISSGGTMISAARLLREHGARSVSIAAAHGEFANSGRHMLMNAPEVDRILVTDSLPQYPELLDALGMTVAQGGKFEVASLADQFAEAIQIMWSGRSMSELYR